MDSLEEKVSVFTGEDYSGKSELNCSLEDYESENSSDQLQHHPEERILYWESQEALLQETLERYNLIGTRLRREIGEIMEVVKASDFCSCSKPNSSGCPYCLRKRVVAMLYDRGFNATLRISKWERTKKFPGGSHEYIEVMASTQTRKRQIPFLIELELRDQFQIARASKEYQKLVSLLPEFYIGKPEYLTAIIQVMCDAAKTSMKEKNIHMGPWRKSSFMQMKWSGLNQKLTTDESSSVAIPSSRQASESCLRISGAPAVAVT